jgi:pimeloyl-ACP methyl ester carboxylesterase
VISPIRHTIDRARGQGISKWTRLSPRIRSCSRCESRWFDSSRGRLHYVHEGNGPPILLCHGNPTWSFLYRDIIVALRDRFRCIAPDYLSFGLSERPYLSMGQDWGGPISMAVDAGHERLRVPADPSTPPMRKAFPDHVVVGLPGANHFIQEDAPGQIAEAITSGFG